MAVHSERVTPDIVVDRLKSGEPVLILDVRSPSAFDEATEDLDGAVRMNPGELKPEFLHIDKGMPIYTFCT